MPPGAPLARAIMLVLNSVNRLSSTILLTGGITPIVAAGLIGTISWTRWFVLMSVPYLALISLAAAAIYLRYRHGFHAEVQVPPRPEPRPLSGVEWRTALITAGAGLLWLTDSIHHWHPTLPALLAWVFFLMPGVGVLTWRQFEQEVGWANFFVLAVVAVPGPGALALRRERLAGRRRGRGGPLGGRVALDGGGRAARRLRGWCGS